MNSATSSPPRQLAVVAVALLVLLAATFGLAHLKLGPWSTAVALLIALAKALLVLLYFMDLRKAPGLLRVAAAAGVFWLGILVSLTLSDFLTRGWYTMPGGWPQPILETIRRNAH